MGQAKLKSDSKQQKRTSSVFLRINAFGLKKLFAWFGSAVLFCAAVIGAYYAKYPTKYPGYVQVIGKPLAANGFKTFSIQLANQGDKSIQITGISIQYMDEVNNIKCSLPVLREESLLAGMSTVKLKFDTTVCIQIPVPLSVDLGAYYNSVQSRERAGIVEGACRLIVAYKEIDSERQFLLPEISYPCLTVSGKGELLMYFYSLGQTWIFEKHDTAMVKNGKIMSSFERDIIGGITWHMTFKKSYSTID